MDEKLETLVGHVVSEMWVSKDGERDLRLITEAGVFGLPTEGDCCSESWWADAVGVKQLFGAPITKVEEIDLPIPADGRGRQEEDVAYGIRIQTEQGVCDLVFRNSSNGYYGGWCTPQWCKQSGLEEMAVQPGYRKISEDWSA